MVMRDVAIIGTGITKFGELWDKSLRALGMEAGLNAIKDAGIYSTDLEALYLGNMSAGRFIQQEHIAPLIADYVGLAGYQLPATRVEAGGASGGLALRQAYAAVASGLHDIVLVGGAEKMTDVGDAEAADILATSLDQEWEAFFGATVASLYAMMARRHMHEFGTTREQLASVAVKNHYHGSMNPKAQFRRAVPLQMVTGAGPVASPLGVFDCAPISDGAAALVLCSAERAQEFTSKPVKIIGSGAATDTMALHDRASLTGIQSTKAAGERAFKRAGIGARDIQVAELHDSFSISEIMATEDLGFFPKGEGGNAVEEKRTYLGGDIPVNTSGGLKARGQPVGATGIAQAVEIALQLRGEAGDRQVKDARYGLTHNLGGTGATAVVHIMEVI